jgi:hypothetical protein
MHQLFFASLISGWQFLRDFPCKRGLRNVPVLRRVWPVHDPQRLSLLRSASKP